MVTIVSHDSGGAEILSSFSLETPESYLFVLEGTARKYLKEN